MRISKSALVAAFVLTAILFGEVAAHADETDQATKLTFSKAIAIPGRVLSAGSYLFKVDPDDSNVVRIYSADGMHYYTTVQSIPTDRIQPAGQTVVTLAKQPGGQPDALVKWFYPGNSIGHEFLYSSQKEQQLVQDRQQNIVGKTAEIGD